MSAFLQNSRIATKIQLKFLPRIGLLISALFLLASNGVNNTFAQIEHASTTLSEVASITHFHPRIEQNTNTDNSIYIYNPTSEDRVIALAFFNMDGTSSYQETGVVPTKSYFILSDTNIDSFLANGTYTFALSSTAQLSVAVREYNTATKTLALSRAGSSNQLAAEQAFGPFFKTAERSSSVYLQDAFGQGSTITADAIDGGGNVLQTITKSISGSGGVTISADEFDQLTDFTGLLRVTSDNLVNGLLAPTSKQNGVGLYLPLQTSSTAQVMAANVPAANSYIPRAYGSFSQGGIAHQTEIFIATKESDDATITLTAYKADGSVDGQGTYSIASSGYLYLAPLTDVNSGFAGSLVFTSNKNIVAAELTETSEGHTMASYGGNTLTSIATARQRAFAAAPMPVPTGPSSGAEDPSMTMPYAGHGADHFSILSIQNRASSSTATVTYAFIDQNGERVQNTVVVPANSPHFVDTRNLSALANGFVGFVKITSDQPISAYVDEYVSSNTTAATPTPAVTQTPAIIQTQTPTVTPSPTPTPSPSSTLTPTPTQPSQTATIPPAAELTATGITTDIDPDTAEVTITVASTIGSDLVARSVATCADGSTPDEVEFVMEKEDGPTEQYTMTPIIVGLYETTIPQADIDTSADLLVSVTCNSDSVISSAIGSINISQPSSKSSKTLRLPIMGR